MGNTRFGVPMAPKPFDQSTWNFTGLITSAVWPHMSKKVKIGPKGRPGIAVKYHVQCFFLLGRPEQPFRAGLCFTRDVLFFSPRFLRDLETDRPETLPHDQNLAVFYKLTSKIRGGAHPKIFGGQKHAKFRSILDHFRFWPRISPECGNKSKIGKTYELAKFLLRLTIKSDELWSTNGLDLHVSLDPLKCTFLAYCIPALRGCCAMKFLHALEIDQNYLAHTPTGTGVPPKKFNREN